MKNEAEEKIIAVLGSTGSIGCQTLEVAAEGGYRVDAVAAQGNRLDLLETQIRKFSPRYCAVADEKQASALKIKISDTETKILSGKNGISEIAGMTKADTVINSIVGRAGLLPTVAALNAGKKLALANKESLVCAGKIVMALAKEKNLPILPVDSEHSAIFQCLRAGKREEVRRLILTASGGPFFGKSASELSKVTVKEALAHPTWSMGKKITVDSATMMNKGFEIMEAAYLFDMPPEKIDVVVHRESIIHSMVEFQDGSVIAEMCLPDMRHCIRYALTYPDRISVNTPPLDLAKLSGLTFYAPDRVNFPLLPFAEKVFKEGGIKPAVMNGANEGAVALFLEGKLSFGGIAETVMRVTEDVKNIVNPTLEEICLYGEEAERKVRSLR